MGSWGAPSCTNFEGIMGVFMRDSIGMTLCLEIEAYDRGSRVQDSGLRILNLMLRLGNEDVVVIVVSTLFSIVPI